MLGGCALSTGIRVQSHLRYHIHMRKMSFREKEAGPGSLYYAPYSPSCLGTAEFGIWAMFSLPLVLCKFTALWKATLVPKTPCLPLRVLYRPLQFVSSYAMPGRWSSCQIYVSSAVFLCVRAAPLSGSRYWFAVAPLSPRSNCQELCYLAVKHCYH